VPGLARDSRKYRDLKANPRAGFVIDDIPADDPESPRGVCIRGTVEVFEDGGEFHPEGVGGVWLRIHLERVISWGLDR
jgi:pyridoxamine 5'-phosphate oxidase family protein